MEKLDPVADRIARIVKDSEAPLETNEVIQSMRTGAKDISRSVILYRLNNLRAAGEISGKQVGSGKGTWIWWYGKYKESSRMIKERTK